MDKDTNVNAPDNAYDPDAAELLKDLDDDDDEEGFGGDFDDNSSPRNSLVNMLTSSANLESLATYPSLPPVAPELAPTINSPKMASSSDFTAAPASAEAQNAEAKHDTDTETQNVSSETKVPERTNTVKLSKTLETRPDSDAAKPSSDVAKSVTDPGRSLTEPIKVSDDIPDPIASDDLSLNRQDARASHPNNKRPPIPPRSTIPGMTPAVTPNARILKDGETAYTQDAIKELMAGGKNDEAPDLGAIKFTDNNWYTQVFNEDFFRTVPKSAPRQTLREAKFIIDRLGIQSGARVLDLCCGYGRHTLELAKRGFDMVGLDLSMVMLKKALADAQANNQAIKFVHGDMRKLNFKAIFDAIYNVQTSFGYFDDLSNFKVLQGIYRALKPGGVFLIETVNRDFLVNDLPLRLWWKGIECMLLEEIDMDAMSGILKVQRSFVFDGAGRPPWEQKIQIRLYTANELRALLMRAGFEVVELSGDYSLPGAYFGATSPKIIMVAEKGIK